MSLNTKSSVGAEPSSRSTSPDSLKRRLLSARQKSSSTSTALGVGTAISIEPLSSVFWNKMYQFRWVRREWFTPSHQALIEQEVTRAKESYEMLIRQAEEASTDGWRGIDEPGCLLCMQRVVRLRMVLEQYLSDLILHRMTASRRDLLNDASVPVHPEPRLSIQSLPAAKPTSDFHSAAFWWCAQRHYTGGWDGHTRIRNFKRERWNKWRDFESSRGSKFKATQELSDQ